MNRKALFVDFGLLKILKVHKIFTLEYRMAAK